MVPVVALIKAKPGQEKTLEDMMKGVVAATRKEAGCIQYDLHRDLADPQMFVFIERWRSDKDLQAHMGSPHLQAAMARKAELIASIEIRSLSPIAVG